MQVITSPEELNWNPHLHSIFLAGSIEQGSAPNWQKEFIESLQNYEKSDNCVIINPRRKAWDPSWPQNRNFPEFLNQVRWELSALEKVTTIALYLAPGTISSISLLEFGKHTNSGKLIVGCPPSFSRHGNVDITCEFYGIPFCESLERLIELTKDRINNFRKLLLE